MKIPFWMTSADRSFIKWAKAQGLRPQIAPNETEWRRAQAGTAHYHGEKIPIHPSDEKLDDYTPSRIEDDG
jgi:hypothetical protein